LADDYIPSNKRKKVTTNTELYGNCYVHFLNLTFETNKLIFRVVVIVNKLTVSYKKLANLFMSKKRSSYDDVLYFINK